MLRIFYYVILLLNFPSTLPLATNVTQFYAMCSFSQASAGTDQPAVQPVRAAMQELRAALLTDRHGCVLAAPRLALQVLKPINLN
jgi:hypothetical protein